MKNITRRVLSLLLTLAILCGLLCTTAFAADGTWSGSGTKADPYQIEDKADLTLLATKVNSGEKYSGKYFKLTADIDVGAWEPIGYSSSYYFAGNFDGDGHTVTISGITQNVLSYESTHYVGLFGYLYSSTAVIHDVTVDGTIAYTGTSYGVYAGGIAGYLYSGTIANCVNHASVTGIGSSVSNGYSGGIVGQTNSNTAYLYNCYNTGTIAGNYRVGGITGYANSGKYYYCLTETGNAFGASYATLTSCYDKSGASAWNWADNSTAEAWISQANASVSSYSSVDDFWSLGGDGYPTHATCQHEHGYATDTVVPPTCTEDGYTVYHCDDCGKDYKGDLVAALGHKLETVTVEATCEQPGSVTKTCQRDGCDYTETTEIPALGHNYENGVCTRCGAKEPAIRTVTIGTGTTSTYAAPYCNYYKYSLSEMLYTAEEIGAAGEITELAFQVATASSYTPSSVQVWMGYKDTASFSATTDYMAADALTLVYSGAPTLGAAAGWETIALDTPFDYNGEDNLVIVVAHSATSYSSTLKYFYTTTANSTVLYRQNDSTASYAQVPGSGAFTRVANRPNLQLTLQTCTHEDRTQINHTDATCTEAAFTTYRCNDCGKEFDVTDSGSTPMGHTFEFVETVDSTCTTQGYDLYECSRCHETEQRNFVPANGHTWGDDDRCTVCGAQKAWDGETMTQPVQQDGVYLIGSGEELAWFANQINSSASNKALNAKLTSDINLGDQDWTPIGKSTTYVYSGTFDGGEHTITGLKVTGSATQKMTGLFGVVTGGAIKNLAVDGIVAGYTVTGGYSGGLIGQSYGVTMDNCANYAAVSGNYAGGLIGTTSSTSGTNTRTAVVITNCYNAGSVTGTEAGGLLGELAGALSSDSIANCFTYGAISASGNYLGTIWGWAATPNPTPVNYYYLNTQSYSSSYTKGVGKNAEEFKTLAASLGSAFVDSAELGHPVLVWEAAETEHEHLYTYVDNGDGTHTGTCAEDGATITEAHVLNADGTCVYCGYKQPGSASEPIQISTVAELQALADEVNSGDSKAGVYYELMNDLTLNGAFTPIGTFIAVYPDEPDEDGNIIPEHIENSFAGHFNGNGKTITLNITDRTGSNARVGLFGSVVGTVESPAVVENVIVTGSVQSYGGSRIAALVGYAQNAEITNCGSGAVVVNFPGEGYFVSNGAAGILGRSDGNVTISGCFNVGSVTAGGYAAGIVYAAAGDTTITNCYDMGTLTATNGSGYTGGIVAVPTVGKNVVLNNCYAAGTYHATKPGAVIGTISQAMRLNNVYYAGSRWLGSEEDYGWSNTYRAPTEITSLTSLAASLGSSFVDGENYPLLTWQSAAVVPTESLHIHNYNDVVTAPTCTEQGYTLHSCTDCDYSYTGSYVDALGHDDSNGYTHNGNGTHSYTCAVCQEVITEDCIYDAGEVTVSPSKTESGIMLYTCTICGGTKTEVIPATGFDGSGTQDDPFILANVSDLTALAEQVNSGNGHAGDYFQLTADVTLESWTPIGTINAPFSGVFNGDYHTVTIIMNDSARDFNSLFGAISGAVVEKVLVDGSITGGSLTAGIAGHATGNSLISCCGNLAAITGGDNHTFGQNQGPNDCYTAGIVAYATGGTVIAGCYNKGEVTNAATTQTTVPGGSKLTGGIVGNLYSGSVQFCYNTGAIASDTSAGVSYTYTGGIAGMSWSNSIMNSYSTGAITGGNYTGGVVGSTNLYYQQDAYSYYLTGSASAGAGTGSDSTLYIQSASADELKNASSTVGQNLSENFKADDESLNDGYLVLGWELDPDFELTYAKDLKTEMDLFLFLNSVRGGHSYEGETVKLCNDIELTSNAWTAIGDVHGTVFNGAFDGQGHTISNMAILNQNSGYLGLFSVIGEDAVVKNLTVTGYISTSSSHVGSIVGWNLGTVENCVSNVDIDASASSYVGGIVGDNAGTVTGCVNNGAVYGSSTSSYVGGVVGHCEPVYDAYSYDALTTPSVTDCVNYGDVTGSEYVGGVVGAEFNDDGACASIIGCANHGNVSSWGYAGGIVGYMSASSSNYAPISLKDCYNTGDVYGMSDVGGILGRASLGELTIENCFSSGEISGLTMTSVGEIAGYTKANIKNSHYVLETSAVHRSAGYCSGANYSRPVSNAYLNTEAFEELIGYTYELPETVDGSASSYKEDDVFTINIYPGPNGEICVAIDRLDDAIYYSLTGFTDTTQDLYYAITDAEKPGENPSVAKTDLEYDRYGCIKHVVFVFEPGSDVPEKEDIEVVAASREIGVYLGDILELNGIDVADPVQYGAYTMDKFPVTTAENAGDAYTYKTVKQFTDGTLETTYGMAAAYVRLSDFLNKFTFSGPGMLANLDYATIAFTPADNVYNPDTDSDYTRTFSLNDEDGKTFINPNDAALVIKGYQTTDKNENLFALCDSLNAVRLIPATQFTTPDNDVSDSVKWIDQITLTFDQQLQFGDVNGDGEITRTDANLITEFLDEETELTALQFLLADVDHSGDVSPADVAQILLNLSNPS